MVDGGATGGAYGGDAGNYKGVMLCNRPSDSSPAGGPEIKPEMTAPQFRPGGLPAEQIGLNPPRDNRMTNVKLAHDEHDRLVAARPEGPTNFLSKHRKWLAEIAKKKKAVHAELEASLAAQATHNKKFVAYSSTLRDAVRGRQAELAADGLPRSPASTAPPPRRAARRPPRRRRRAPAAPAAAPPPPSSAKSTKKSTKPSWAMTETRPTRRWRARRRRSSVLRGGSTTKPWTTSRCGRRST